MFGRNRLFEWVMTAMMLGIALTIAMYPNTVTMSSFHYIRLLGFKTDYLGVSFLCFGVLRAGALIANGHWRVVGPMMRAIGSIGGAFLWFTLDLSLWQVSHQTGVVSIGVAVYASLSIGEIISAFRAGTDVRPKLPT